MTRVLLTTVFRPYNARDSKYNSPGDEEWLDYLSSRVAREPGPFSLSSYINGTTLPVIAANIDADVTVLVHPTVEEYVEELKLGFDYVGLSFLVKGLGKIPTMITAARRHCPRAKIVIGGFGTMLHNVSQVGADYICRGEGVAFFRELLGDPGTTPVNTGATRLRVLGSGEAPIRNQPLVTTDITLKAFRSDPTLPRFRYAELTHGFGCPHKCEFCTTSAFYGYRHIPFAIGRSLYDAMAQVHDTTGIGYFVVYEEDMCLYRRSVEEWGSLIRADTKRDLSWACFSTVKSLSTWDLEQLVAMGLSHVWIGIESANSPFGKSAGMALDALVARLHELGVTTTGSMIFGLDHHTPENIAEEVAYLQRVRPTMAQVGVLMPADGTELRARLEREGRIRKVTYREADLFAEIIVHPAFKPGELRDAALKAYDAYYERCGPTVLRMAQTWLRGSQALRGSSNVDLRRRGRIALERAKALRPIFLCTSHLMPSQDVRAEVASLLEAMEPECGAVEAGEMSRGREVCAILERVVAEQGQEKEPVEPVLTKRRWIRGVELDQDAEAVSSGAYA